MERASKRLPSRNPTTPRGNLVLSRTRREQISRTGEFIVSHGSYAWPYTVRVVFQ